MAGFSVGASIALIAASDPRIAGRVRWINAFGGFGDAQKPRSRAGRLPRTPDAPKLREVGPCHPAPPSAQVGLSGS
jgi:hypothetical protein